MIRTYESASRGIWRRQKWLLPPLISLLLTAQLTAACQREEAGTGAGKLSPATPPSGTPTVAVPGAEGAGAEKGMAYADTQQPTETPEAGKAPTPTETPTPAEKQRGVQGEGVKEGTEQTEQEGETGEGGEGGQTEQKNEGTSALEALQKPPEEIKDSKGELLPTSTPTPTPSPTPTNTPTPEPTEPPATSTPESASTTSGQERQVQQAGQTEVNLDQLTPEQLAEYLKEHVNVYVDPDLKSFGLTFNKDAFFGHALIQQWLKEILKGGYSVELHIVYGQLKPDIPQWYQIVDNGQIPLFPEIGGVAVGWISGVKGMVFRVQGAVDTASKTVALYAGLRNDGGVPPTDLNLKRSFGLDCALVVWHALNCVRSGGNYDYTQVPEIPRLPDYPFFDMFFSPVSQN